MALFPQVINMFSDIHYVLIALPLAPDKPRVDSTEDLNVLTGPGK